MQQEHRTLYRAKGTLNKPDFFNNPKVRKGTSKPHINTKSQEGEKYLIFTFHRFGEGKQ